MVFVQRFLIFDIVLALFALSACDNPETEQPETTEEKVSWADGLSTDQVISAMPIEVTDDALEEEGAAEAPEVMGIRVRRLAMNDDTNIKYLRLSWFLPIRPWVEDVTWRVFHRNDDGEWSRVEVDIDVEEVDGEYHYQTKCGIELIGQRIVYFKVQMVDNNDDEYENIVSFFVYPNDRRLRITLSEETSADAPSELFIGFREWFRLFWDIHELELPTSKEVEEDLSSWTTVLFLLKADFSQWFDGDEASVVRKSNTSYCKVTTVDPPDDTVEARLRYSFEDLPITRLANEPSGYFDYNDMIFFVDILNPEE
jgi:hypothetical protein